MKTNLKATVDPTKLRAAIAIASRVLGAKAAMPVIDCVYLRGDKATQRIHVQATNLDIAIATSFPATVETAGGVCVPGQRFLGIAGAVEGETATIEVAANMHMKFACGRSTFRIHGIGEDEFPPMREIDGGATLKFTQPDLSAIIESVSSAQSDDETRYILNGINVERRGDADLFFVATDGRRLHLNRHTVADASQGLIGSVIVPAKAVSCINGLLSAGDATIRYNKNTFHVTMSRPDGEITLVSKVVEGNYPNWQQVMTKYTGAGLSVPREEMIAALQRAKLALSEKNTSVRLTIKETTIEIFAQSPDMGEANEIIECGNTEKRAGVFACNADYIIDGLAGMDAEKVTFRLDPSKMDVSPLSIRQQEKIDVVIMPVRLS